MMITLEELVKKSGDSELLKYDFSDGCLAIELELDELDALAKLKISTNVVSAGRLSDKDLQLRTCYVNILELGDVLSVENGYYLPPSEFPVLMKHERERISLAYGKKVATAKILFQLKSSSILLACLICDERDIELSIET